MVAELVAPVCDFIAKVPTKFIVQYCTTTGTMIESLLNAAGASNASKAARAVIDQICAPVSTIFEVAEEVCDALETASTMSADALLSTVHGTVVEAVESAVDEAASGALAVTSVIDGGLDEASSAVEGFVDVITELQQLFALTVTTLQELLPVLQTALAWVKQTYETHMPMVQHWYVRALGFMAVIDNMLKPSVEEHAAWNMRSRKVNISSGPFAAVASATSFSATSASNFSTMAASIASKAQSAATSATQAMIQAAPAAELLTSTARLGLSADGVKLDFETMDPEDLPSIVQTIDTLCINLDDLRDMLDRFFMVTVPYLVGCILLFACVFEYVFAIRWLSYPFAVYNAQLPGTVKAQPVVNVALESAELGQEIPPAVLKESSETEIQQLHKSAKDRDIQDLQQYKAIQDKEIEELRKHKKNKEQEVAALHEQLAAATSLAESAQAAAALQEQLAAARFLLSSTVAPAAQASAGASGFSSSGGIFPPSSGVASPADTSFLPAPFFSSSSSTLAANPSPTPGRFLEGVNVAFDSVGASMRSLFGANAVDNAQKV